MNKTLAVKLVYSLLSGTAVGLIFADWGIFSLVVDEPIVYLACGTVFACGVLLPYFKMGKWAWERLLAVVAVSSLSLYAAVLLAIDSVVFSDMGVASFTLASLAGATIVLAPFAWLCRTRITPRLFGFGLIAALLGGPLTRYTLIADSLLLAIIGHAGWHLLLAMALHFGTADAFAKANGKKAPERTMADVWKSRGVLS